MGNYVWPCPDYVCVSSGYGNRYGPFYGYEFHDGVDLAADGGRPILACAPGTVEMAGWNGGYGNYVSINHANGLMSFYGHASAIHVSAGQTVQAGQKIASVGTTGSSTGNHLHFGMHKDGQSVNPMNYVSDKDTVSNYTGSGSAGGSSVQNRVKAMYTAYYPANNAMEGGFYDAQGNLLDTSKNTMAAPANVPFGTQITIQATGTSRDGTTYTVNDRGGAITIVDGVYHFDILMKNASEANAWGVRHGYALIGGDGSGGGGSSSGSDSGTEEEKRKEITTVKVQSVTGTATAQKSKLRDAPVYLKNGVEILIQNKKIYAPCVESGVTLERPRKGAPAKLSFTVMKDDILKFTEGAPVSMRFNGEKVFHGYVFTKSREDFETIKVTAYDQLRYLKNKDTLSYVNKSYSDLLKMIAKDYNLQVGDVEETKFKMTRIEECTLIDMLQNASDETVLNTGRLYVLYDDFGKLSLKNITSMKVNIVVDPETAQSFEYSSTIDSNSYNKVKIAYDNDETGVREVHIRNHKANQAAWGQLQYYEKINENATEAQIKEKAKYLLDYYGKTSRTLKVNGVAGDIRVRGGSSVIVLFQFDDFKIQNYMCVESVKHTWDNGLHTMDLTLCGIKGEFQA